jgi:hypothetical protein
MIDTLLAAAILASQRRLEVRQRQGSPSRLPASRENSAVLLLLSLLFSHFALARFLCRSGRAVLSITDNQSGALAVKRRGARLSPRKGQEGALDKGKGGDEG